ncbi:DNA-binding transcriptional regulator, MerR family [Gordonia malaquae]|uniref:Putative MerR family transcriptional regulator n=1 Tax=Gordonia malaquae NBRC 108250 TaxID=1223542 RepID=M3TEN1_GORML|nr:MerR family transcriptional regulator [Gordonia malaquae]GAC79871.1 putative MerR family transcriptional regulator [Gordonia malaquae NBRC 108250]SEB77908.1 DNA-binding transcriptional regulator, MerR family [Gordonia malaquae]
MPEDMSIADVSARTGLSRDTLRWYEAEGLIPAVPRSSAGVRRYDDTTIRMIDLLVRLRRTGMSVAHMRDFVTMVDQGARTHGRRMRLLEDHREEIESRIRELIDDLESVDDKIAHYRRLIDAGLDCSEQPINDPAVIEQQRLLGD